MTKKIFAISTLLLVFVVAFAFAYNFIFKKPDKSQSAEKATPSKSTQAEEGKVSDTPFGRGRDTDPSEKTAGDASAPKENSSVSAVSEGPVFGAILSPDGKSICFLLAGNGQLNQVSLEGKLGKVLSTEKYEDIRKVLWNNPKDKILIETRPDSGKTKHLIYDLSAKRVSVLKENIDSAVWSNLGDKIIYKYYDPKTKKRTVSVSDPDGKNWRDIAEFDFQNVDISPRPESSDVSFWPTADSFLATVVGIAPLGGGNKREIIRDRFGADLLWSPDGKTAALSYALQKGGSKTDLALVNSDGNQFQPVGFPTFASKCVWSGDSKFLFCALPGNIPDSAVVPNDWQAGKIRTADTFWKIEAATGKKERLVEAENISGSYDVLNPFLSRDEKILFFMNKTDGKLYKLKM